jgi:hypothetical protein
MSDLRPTQQFMIAYAALRNATGDSPNRLANMFANDQRLTDLSHEVRAAWNLINWLSTYRKSFPQVGAAFIEAEKDYRDRWRPAIEYVCKGELLSINLWNEPNFAPPTFEEFKAGKSWLQPREEAEPGWDDSFDPVRHEGGLAVRSMLSLVEDLVEGHEEEQANTLKIGLEALEHFETATGIRIADAFNRWNQLPSVFVPPHVSNRHGPTDRGSLFGLLNEAMRSYVAGAPGAALAMCRAVLEMVLKEHYLAEEDVSRDGLKRLIRRAVKSGKFSNDDESRATDIKSLADAVLHRKLGLTAEDEARLILAFGHLKHWIESAPVREPRA